MPMPLSSICAAVSGAGDELSEIIDPRGPALTVTGRDIPQSAPQKNFRRRTVWLIDESVRSGAEVLAYTIRRDGYGCWSGATPPEPWSADRPLHCPMAVWLYVAVVDLAVDGKRLEGVGVAPDITVPFPLPLPPGPIRDWNAR